MATGNYGTIRGATVKPSDVEIIMLYSPTRDSIGNQTPTQQKLTSTEVLSQINDQDSGVAIGGLYNLKLPANIFNQKGFYTVLIRPRQINTAISDVGVLSSIPSVVGLVFDVENSVDAQDLDKFRAGGLTGYRVEYIQNGIVRPNFFRVITSSNFAEASNTGSGAANAANTIRYRLVDQGTSLLFCTVTPSTPHSSRPNLIPEIGQGGQNVIISNTFFDPIMLEVEMMEHDFDTLGIGIFGEQIKRNSDGNLTMYDNNKNIYKQYSIWEYQNRPNNPLYQIRQFTDSLDLSMDFNQITNNGSV